MFYITIRREVLTRSLTAIVSLPRFNYKARERGGAVIPSVVVGALTRYPAIARAGSRFYLKFMWGWGCFAAPGKQESQVGMEGVSYSAHTP